MEILQSQQRGEPCLQSKELPPKVIARFWTRMAEIYGHKWASQFGDCADPDGGLTSAAQTWAQGLASIPLESISVGFSALVKKGSEWPPSLPEFLATCQPAKRLAPYHKMAIALPSPPVDPILVRDSLAQLRKILNNSAYAQGGKSGASEKVKPQQVA
jgi:hypothetical protein